MRAAWLVLVFAAACMKTSEKYCELHRADDPDHCPAPDAPMGPACTGDPDCTDTPATPVCDTAAMTCVECVTSASCSAPNPTCLMDRTCGRCMVDDDCMSKVCLPDGSCADSATVAYVDPAGSGAACSLTEPCATVDTAAQRARPIIKIKGTVTDNSVTVLEPAGTLDIYAEPGAKMHRTGSGSILEVRGATAHVRIHDLEIGGATGGSSAHGIVMSNDSPTLELDHVLLVNNSGLGIMTSTGTLSMDRCVVTGNAAGGASVQMTDYTIVNSLFVNNGTPQGGTTGSSTGGITLGTSTVERFEFNTVVGNLSSFSTQVGRGVNCTAQLEIANNIIFDNRPGLNCTVTYSLLDMPGGTNITGDPLFRSMDPADYAMPTYYRIMAQSPARDAADPAATLDHDIDGDMRPHGAARDIGADEAP